MATHRALKAYRQALRAIKVAFNNDIQTLNAAREKIKNDMKLEKSLLHPDFNVDQRIELLEQVSTFLRRNIVQGVKNEQKETKYTLNIHKDTELGDNDDLKKKKSTLSVGSGAAGGCCGGGKVELKEKK